MELTQQYFESQSTHINISAMKMSQSTVFNDYNEVEPSNTEPHNKLDTTGCTHCRSVPLRMGNSNICMFHTVKAESAVNFVFMLILPNECTTNC